MVSPPPAASGLTPRCRWRRDHYDTFALFSIGVTLLIGAHSQPLSPVQLPVLPRASIWHRGEPAARSLTWSST